MKIHAIQTGTVAVKTRQREGVGHGLRRQLNTLIDREWSDQLPIYAFAIEHPEGVILVDTGETARACEAGYFPWWHPYFRLNVRMWVTPDQEIGPQLERLGIAPSDVRKVVLTHMHTDHAGGLRHLGGREVLVSRAELELASGRAGLVRGYLTNRFPAEFRPTALDLPPDPFGPFPSSLPLTSSGDVVVVGLAGHTPGQIGVIVTEDDRAVLLAGDSSYSQGLLLERAIDGVSPNEEEARQTIDRILEFARTRPTVYLVAHDPETGARLERRETLPVAAP